MPGHAVQFYGDDRELAACAGDFLAGGIEAGGAGVVVATAAHRRLFGGALTDRVLTDRLLTVDADETLRGFLTGDGIDEPRFRAAAEALIGQAASNGKPVRIYAEMVALLWEAGQVYLAIELEGLWNDLAARLPFSLLCGYPARLLAAGDKERAAVRQVCRLHTSVTGRAPGTPGAPVARDFPRDLRSARAARQFVLGELDPRAGEAIRGDAAIVTGELAANAVLHAHSAFTVIVTALPDGVRIAVRDATPLSGDPPLVVRAGHGLDVVAQLAARWAVEPLPGGKLIWADLG
jgi:MEDS: MEthanogen/methylotroph, DcmR Sensory domain